MVSEKEVLIEWAVPISSSYDVESWNFTLQDNHFLSAKWWTIVCCCWCWRTDATEIQLCISANFIVLNIQWVFYFINIKTIPHFVCKAVSFGERISSMMIKLHFFNTRKKEPKISTTCNTRIPHLSSTKLVPPIQSTFSLSLTICNSVVRQCCHTECLDFLVLKIS